MGAAVTAGQTNCETQLIDSIVILEPGSQRVHPLPGLASCANQTRPSGGYYDPEQQISNQDDGEPANDDIFYDFIAHKTLALVVQSIPSPYKVGSD